MEGGREGVFQSPLKPFLDMYLFMHWTGSNIEGQGGEKEEREIGIRPAPSLPPPPHSWSGVLLDNISPSLRDVCTSIREGEGQSRGRKNEETEGENEGGKKDKTEGVNERGKKGHDRGWKWRSEKGGGTGPEEKGSFTFYILYFVD